MNQKYFAKLYLNPISQTQAITDTTHTKLHMYECANKVLYFCVFFFKLLNLNSNTFQKRGRNQESGTLYPKYSKISVSWMSKKTLRMKLPQKKPNSDTKQRGKETGRKRSPMERKEGKGGKERATYTGRRDKQEKEVEGKTNKMISWIKAKCVIKQQVFFIEM